MRAAINHFASAVLVVGMTSSTQCLAWGPLAHQVIAHIAAKELTTAARSQIEQLLGGPAEEAMVQASTWADEIHNQRPATASWHFVDIPVGSSGYDANRDCARDNCVVAQIERDERILGNHALSASVRAEALRFLIHFVADIHQPLHAADNMDRGGTGLRVVLARRETNMHSVWDADLVRNMGRNGETIAERIEGGIVQSPARPWQFGTAASWANESFQIAKQEIYSPNVSAGSSAPIILPREYLVIEENIAKAQLEKGGMRLAWVLDRALR